jgi:hypothetical protein
MDRYHRRRSAGRAAEPCSSGVVLIETGPVDDPRFAAVGRRTLSRIEGWAEPPR